MTGSTGPTPKTQAAPPASAIAEVIRNGVRKFPERFTINPVSAGAITPAKFPNPPWKPVHVPAAFGPARIWQNA